MKLSNITVEIRDDNYLRFINLLNVRKIRIKSITVDNKDGQLSVKFVLGAKDYLSLAPIIRKTKIRPRIIKKHGILFQLRLFLLKRSVIVGLVIFIGIIWILTRFIWNVKVEGNYLIDENEYLKVIAEYDAGIFALKNSIKCNELNECIRNRLPCVRYASARIEGCTLILEVKERTEKNDDNYIDNCIKSPCNGIIESIFVRSGKALVAKGDEVAEGDIIVDGVVEIKNDAGELVKVNQTIADADVKIACELQYEARIPTKYSVKEYGEPLNRMYIGSKSKKIILLKPFNMEDTCDIMINEFDFPAIKRIFSKFSIGKVSYYSYSIKDFEYSEQELKEILTQKLNKDIDDLKNDNISLIKYDLDFLIRGDEASLSGILYVIRTVR